jgi:hypothetical protein
MTYSKPTLHLRGPAVSLVQCNELVGIFDRIPECDFRYLGNIEVGIDD